MVSKPSEDELELAKEIKNNKNIYKIKDESIDGFVVRSMDQPDEHYLIILPRFCTCQHFQIRCLQIPGKVCKHILAAELSKKIRSHYKGDWRELLYRE